MCLLLFSLNVIPKRGYIIYIYINMVLNVCYCLILFVVIVFCCVCYSLKNSLVGGTFHRVRLAKVHKGQ